MSLDKDFAYTCFNPHLGLASAKTIKTKANIKETFFIKIFKKSALSNASQSEEFTKLPTVFFDILNDIKNIARTTKTTIKSNK